ncbi:Wadjet anti-phage system protein JetD domain-containing protein [Chitinophaga flava]|uniref:Wadjet protein JetD C-terminal domain-containing protein n=1 Tax=Chitinophaga flava TaxID=2259036 RepID=A0A365XYN9_9BACT|nr:DUF2220 family protein [Chitinophaga flava]RBL91178.1 hypothetical protein DF182_00710 [Chitinophaga flava]
MNWQTFKSLHELYVEGKTRYRSSLDKEPVFKYYAAQAKELLITKNEILVRNKTSFEKSYSSRYLDKYNVCRKLLDDIGENTPQCRFEDTDILCLHEMKEQMEAGLLQEIRQQIIDSNETRRGVSNMFFKHEKHLDTSVALERAVKTILQIETFADTRDHQYLYVMQCLHPKAIVLCENLYFLKMPEKARNNKVELWYAGGRNVEKLKYSNHRNLPIYYMCDWDHDGLDIYRSVKEKLPQIQLLTPNGAGRSILLTEHRSLWRYPDSPALLSGLEADLLTGEQQQLIQTLITEDKWIVEESNDLMALLQVDKVFSSSTRHK